MIQKRADRSGKGNEGDSPLTLPPKIPRQRRRPAQSGIPDERPVRDRLWKLATHRVKSRGAIPPLTLEELREHTTAVLDAAGLDCSYEKYTAILVNNAAWQDTLARIPYDRRLLLLPRCLRVEETCPATFDAIGLICKECRRCSIHDLTREAEELGYAVLVAEGSAMVRQMIEAGRIEAIVGVSCINVLEKCYPHMEAAAIPGAAIPLLQNDCANTTVDLDRVRDWLHLSATDRTFSLDLDAVSSAVKKLFEEDSLREVMGEQPDETARIARAWLGRAGKRWRPFLAACTYMALREGPHEMPADLKKAAVAIECFHKASLIHDDIEDGDETRYGRPALHVEAGVPVALNAGDFLLGEGYRLLGEVAVEPRIQVEMFRTASAGHVTLSRGQGRELSWSERPVPLSSLQVLDIFRQKTAAAFEVALRLGAHLGGADRATHAVLHEYSESLGIAYQIRDDLQDFDDVEERRLSLILAIAHKRAREGAEKELIESLYRIEIPFAEVAGEVHRILSERKVIEKAEDLLEAYKQDAIRSLRFLSSATLKGLLRRVVGKIFGEHLIEGYCSEFEARNAAGRKAGTGGTRSRG